MEQQEKKLLTLEIEEGKAFVHFGTHLHYLKNDIFPTNRIIGQEWDVFYIDRTCCATRELINTYVLLAIGGNYKSLHLDQPERGWHSPVDCPTCQEQWARSGGVL